jgi:cephalosporin-C deacetylase-like acetyl esterase
MNTEHKPHRFPSLIEGVEREMLFKFHLSLYEHARSNRDSFWNNLTPKRWQAERARLRRVFRGMFGPFPERCRLEPRVTRSFRRDGYRVENVMYLSLPGMPITANLYVPENRSGRVPGIVLACGHAGNGKAYPSYQLAAIDMARRGMVALCFDPVSQGERYQLWDHVRQRMLAPFEHNVLDRPAVLAGGSVAGQFVWDAIRSIDYLVAREEVDPARIGMAGNSGGGTQTTWTASVDERIAVAVPMCFVTSVRERLLSREPADAEQNPIDMLKHGLEYADFLAMLAPKPLLVGAAKEDFFPIQGAYDTVSLLKRLWALTGDEEKVQVGEVPGKHALGDQMRRNLCDWFCRWFGVPIPDTDKSAEPEPDERLWVTRSGQLATDGSAESCFAVAASTIARHGRIKFEQAKLRKILGMPATRKQDSAPLEKGGSVALEYGASTCLRLCSERGITVPCAFLEPKASGSSALVLYCHEDGFEGQSGPGGMIERLVLAGHAVFAFDPRGVGLTRGDSFGWWANSTRPHLEAMRNSGALPYNALGYNDPSYEGPYCTEFEHAMTAQMLGRPLLGQRAFDALRVIEAIGSMPEAAGRPLILAGTGSGALWCLYAAALTSVRLTALILHAPLASYRLLVEEPRALWNPSIVARGLLPGADCPDVLRTLSPLPVLLIDPANAFRAPISEADAGRLLGKPSPKGLQLCRTEHAIHPAEIVLNFLKKTSRGKKRSR